MKILLSTFLRAIFFFSLVLVAAAIGQCSVTVQQIELNDSSITISGQSSGCPEVGVHWNNPALPDKTVLRPNETIAWSISYSTADGLTPAMLAANFSCGSGAFSFTASCSGRSCTIHQDPSMKVACKGNQQPPACPDQISLAVTASDGAPVDITKCLLPGTYTVRIEQNIPPGFTILWEVGDQDYPTNLPEHTVTLDRGQDSIVEARVDGPNCNKHHSIDITGCNCGIIDIEFNPDSCNSANGINSMIAEGEVDGIPGQAITATLTVTNSATGNQVGHQTRSESDGDVNLSLPVNVPDGSYDVVVIITSPESCVDTLTEHFTLDSCKVKGGTPENPNDHGQVNPPPPPPPTVHQAGYDWCCVMMFLILIFLVAAAIALFFAICIPNPVSITIASILGAIAIGLFIFWLIVCPSWTVDPGAFCNLLLTFIEWLGIIESIFFLIAIVIWILIGLGLIPGVCAGIASAIDAGVIGTMLGILTTLAHFVFHCF